MPAVLLVRNNLQANDAFEYALGILSRQPIGGDGGPDLGTLQVQHARERSLGNDFDALEPGSAYGGEVVVS
jgi:hypothetical protein